jgi:hypothetical protein
LQAREIRKLTAAPIRREWIDGRVTVILGREPVGV